MMTVWCCVPLSNVCSDKSVCSEAEDLNHSDGVFLVTSEGKGIAKFLNLKCYVV